MGGGKSAGGRRRRGRGWGYPIFPNRKSTQMQELLEKGVGPRFPCLPPPPPPLYLFCARSAPKKVTKHKTKAFVGIHIISAINS